MLATLVGMAAVASCGPRDHDDDGAAAGPGTRAPDARGRPNIVLIMTDDMTLDELRYLPRTQRLLGDHGTTFTEFTAPQPLCCPSRAQLLTGQYAQNNGVRHNAGPLGGYARFDPSTALPVWLQDAGYATAMVGKYLNGYADRTDPAALTEGPEVGWDHWDPTVRRIYQYLGYSQYDTDAPDGAALTRPAAYHTDYVAARSEELVTELAAGEQPFFLWSSFVGPHGRCALRDEARGCEAPPLVAPRHRDRFTSAHPTAPTSLAKPSFDEPHVGDKPHFLRRSTVRADEMTYLQTKRAGALAAVDEAVAGIVGSLRRAGVLDRTLVVFTSDNGYLLGEHRYVGKVLAYEESVRVPLLMRGLGLPDGATDAQTGAMIDLAPTFAALAGATPLVPVDGHPLVVRRGAAAQQTDDRTLLVQAGVDDVVTHPTGWWFRGVRTSRYTYVRYDRGFVELYDRERDPYELRNVADDPRYAATRLELERRTAVLGDCSGDACEQDLGPVPDPVPEPVGVRR